VFEKAFRKVDQTVVDLGRGLRGSALSIVVHNHAGQLCQPTSDRRKMVITSKTDGYTSKLPGSTLIREDSRVRS